MRRIILLTISIIWLSSCGSSQQIDTLKSKERATIERIMPDLDLDRFEEQIVAFEKKDMVSRYAGNMALFVGSSSIRGWTSLAKDMAPYPVLNRGFGGSTLPEVNHYFDRVVSAYKPKQIFLYCGENDLAMTFTVEETVDAFVEFIGHCKEKLPNTEIVFISMKPSPSRWYLWDKYAEANQLIKNICVLSNQLHYVDIASSMLTEEGIPDKTIFVEDMLHMQPEGYVRWTAMVKPVLDELRNQD